jgi:nucleotide-binding universal stress UspA family protein
MSASQPHQTVSEPVVRGLGDYRQRGRIDRPARLALLGEFPGYREGARQTNVLVVAIDPVAPGGLGHADVFVVAPALNSWFRHWLSDEDPARRRAEERLAAVVGQLQRAVVHVEGRVGDADPLQAIADALTTFSADEIVISARPERSTEQVDDLVSRARERFALPISWAAGSRSIAA